MKAKLLFLKLKPTKRRLLNLTVVLSLFFLALAAIRLYPHPPLWQKVPLSSAVYDDQEQLLRLTLASDQRYRLWLPLEEFSPELVEGALLHEDNWFYLHPGFNPLSLVRSGWRTYLGGGIRQGGSTITMQLARLRWDLNTKNLPGKIVQIAYALQLELCYSKKEILEAYLNLAPYGRNIEGAGTASFIYFSKHPKNLTLPESLALAVLPQAPNKRVSSILGSYAPAQMNVSLAKARNGLYARWLEIHPEDAGQTPLFQMPLVLKRPEDLPFLAPHFVEQVLRKYRFKNENTPIIKTSLNLPLQKLLERRISHFLEANQSRGLNNAAAVLLDTRNMEVKALVGSGGYFKRDISGQINGTAIKRSPGSTLKPFIYALALDQGVLHPQTVLKDVPSAFGPYTPENFDGRFLGPVTATEALVRSRNIPAVYVAAQLESPNLYQFLQNAGVGKMASQGHYGLALVLGGGEVSAQELARLYAILANQGKLQPLHFEANSPSSGELQLISPEAAYITLQMLAENPRPDNTMPLQPQSLPVYWKTGTSWGFRDAWSAGIMGPYVLVVWLGNFNNTGNQDLVGGTAAAPLFFGILDALRAEYPELSKPDLELTLRPKPEHLARVDVCLASGNLPTAWCPQKGKTWFIPGKSPIKVDNVHRPVYFNRETNEPACLEPGRPIDPNLLEAKVYEFWSSDLRKAFARAGLPKIIPPRNQMCADAESIVQGQPPRITSPLKGKTYTLQVQRTDPQQIAFSATIDADASIVYWFVNGAFVSRAGAGETFYWQPGEEGLYTVQIVDERGRSSQRKVRVDYAN